MEIIVARYTERLRAGGGGSETSGKLFSVLQPGASAPGAGLPNAGGDLLRKTEKALRRRKKGEAGGRATSGPSLIEERGAKFFCDEVARRDKKEKRSKKERTEGLWKLTPRMGIRPGRGFPPRLEKDLAKDARLFHSSPRPDGGYKLTNLFRQRSTLRSLIFCPNNGEHFRPRRSIGLAR